MLKFLHKLILKLINQIFVQSMQLFNIPGFVKLFFAKENVQTKYSSIHQIPIMTLNKQIAYIPKPKNQSQNLIFLHCKNIRQNSQLLARFVQLKNKNYNVYLIPEQSPFQNFKAIQENTPNGLTALGKMTINGKQQHPLIKFLKNNCQSLYDFKMLGASPVNQETGAFIKNSKNRVKYLKKRQFAQFLDKQLGVLKLPEIPTNLKEPK